MYSIVVCVVCVGVFSYELVRQLHSKVQVAVGGLIKEKVEEHTSSEGGVSWGEEQERATHIAEEVLHSKQLSCTDIKFLSPPPLLQNFLLQV